MLLEKTKRGWGLSRCIFCAANEDRDASNREPVPFGWEYSRRTNKSGLNGKVQNAGCYRSFPFKS